MDIFLLQIINSRNTTVLLHLSIVGFVHVHCISLVFEYYTCADYRCFTDIRFDFSNICTLITLFKYQIIDDFLSDLFFVVLYSKMKNKCTDHDCNTDCDQIFFVFHRYCSFTLQVHFKTKNLLCVVKEGFCFKFSLSSILLSILEKPPNAYSIQLSVRKYPDTSQTTHYTSPLASHQVDMTSLDVRKLQHNLAKTGTIHCHKPPA